MKNEWDFDKWDFSKPLKVYQKALFVLYGIIGAVTFYAVLVIGCLL